MKTKRIFLLGFLVAFFSFQIAFGESLVFDDNTNGSITIKGIPGFRGELTVRVDRGVMRCETRPDGNINMIYRGGEHSIIVMDKGKLKRIEIYWNSNPFSNRLFDNNGRLYKEVYFDKRGKVVGENEYISPTGSNLNLEISKQWFINRNGDRVKKSYFSNYCNVEVEDKFGRLKDTSLYKNGVLSSTTYYKKGKKTYRKFSNGRIERFDKYGNLIEKTDEPEDSSTIRKKFIDDLFSLGTKKDKVIRETDKPSSPFSTDRETQDDITSLKPKETNTGIIGTWEETTRSEDGTVTIRFIFDRDGTFESDTIVTVYGEGTSNDPARGKYEVQGNILKVWGEYDTVPSDFDFKVEGNKLYLAGSVFTRKN
jgi:hypothetical protein